MLMDIHVLSPPLMSSQTHEQAAARLCPQDQPLHAELAPGEWWWVEDGTGVLVNKWID
jgi:hypothetical protein